MSHERESRRLSLLKALAGAAAYTLNESVITQALDRFGFAVTRDLVRGEIAWLAEAGLLSVRTVEDYMIATLTERGSDVQDGRAEYPGVARPSAPRG